MRVYGAGTSLKTFAATFLCLVILAWMPGVQALGSVEAAAQTPDEKVAEFDDGALKPLEAAWSDSVGDEFVDLAPFTLAASEDQSATTQPASQPATSPLGWPEGDGADDGGDETASAGGPHEAFLEQGMAIVDISKREADKQVRKLAGSPTQYEEYPSQGIAEMLQGGSESVTEREAPAPAEMVPTLGRARGDGAAQAEMEALGPGEDNRESTNPPDDTIIHNTPAPGPATFDGAFIDSPPLGELLLPASITVAVALLTLALYRLAAFVGPLFSRLTGADVLDDPTRAVIHEAITAHPGITIPSLSERVDLHRSTLRHHLGILERERQIRIHAVGKLPHIYPHDPQILRELDARTCLAHVHRSRVAELILQRPGRTQKEVCRASHLPPSRVHIYASELAGAGLVEAVRQGRCRAYFPTNLLRSLAPKIDIEGRPST